MCVGYLFLPNRLSPKHNSLKRHTLIFSKFLWIRNPGTLFRAPCLRIAHTLCCDRGVRGVESCRGPTARPPVSVHCLWLLAGLMSLLAVELGSQFLLMLHQFATWQVVSLGANRERGPKQKPQSLCNLVWEVTFRHFVPCSSHGSESRGSAHSQGEGITRGYEL